MGTHQELEILREQAERVIATVKKEHKFKVEDQDVITVKPFKVETSDIVDRRDYSSSFKEETLIKTPVNSKALQLKNEIRNLKRQLRNMGQK